MTMFRSLFGTEKTAVIEVGYVVAGIDGTFVHQTIEDSLVFRPIDSSGSVVREQLFGRRKIRDVPVTDTSNLLEEIRQIGTLCEPCQLAAVADAHVDQRPHMMCLEQLKKLLGTLLGKTDGV